MACGRGVWGILFQLSYRSERGKNKTLLTFPWYSTTCLSHLGSFVSFRFQSIDICDGIKQGFLNGKGKTFWLESATTWKRNELARSLIFQNKVPRPFIYEGRFKQDCRHDPRAKVTLKDGTVKVGPWAEDNFVGDWWTDHEDASSYPKQNESSISRRASSSNAKKRPNKAKSTQKTKQAKSSKEDNDHENNSSLESRFISISASGSFVLDDEENDGLIPSSSDNLNSYEDRKEQLIHSISNWLCGDDAIGANANPKEMSEYAERFYEEGCHSPEAIMELCDAAPDYLTSLTWMKPAHKLLIQHHRVKVKEEPTTGFDC